MTMIKMTIFDVAIGDNCNSCYFVKHDYSLSYTCTLYPGRELFKLDNTGSFSITKHPKCVKSSYTVQSHDYLALRVPYSPTCEECNFTHLVVESLITRYVCRFLMSVQESLDPTFLRIKDGDCKIAFDTIAALPVSERDFILRQMNILEKLREIKYASRIIKKKLEEPETILEMKKILRKFLSEVLTPRMKDILQEVKEN
jgi:hypothetical protein